MQEGKGLSAPGHLCEFRSCTCLYIPFLGVFLVFLGVCVSVAVCEMFLLYWCTFLCFWVGGLYVWFRVSVVSQNLIFGTEDL